MRLVLQRGIGDCGLAALCTYAELSYEDAFVVMAKVERTHRGKNGVQWAHLRRVAQALGFRVRLRRTFNINEHDGLLAVQWLPDSPHASGTFGQHLVALADGIVADPADGVILPVDEYLTRAKATPGALMELA